MTVAIPHDHEAERALLGAALISAPARQTLAELDLRAFHDQRHGLIAAAILAVDQVDEVTVTSALGAHAAECGAPASLVDLMAAVPAISNHARYADVLTEHLHRRLVQAWAVQVHEAATTGDGLDDVLAKIPTTDGGLSDAELTPETVEDFRARPVEARGEWVIPGLMRRGWRAIVVAREGVGKMVLLRQMAVAASQGVHPFTHQPIPPMRALVVDLENPADVIDDHLALAMRGLRGEWVDGQSWQWRRPAGINIRERKWQVALDRVCAKVRPDLVCLGPLYKAFRSKASEGWEEVAVEACNALDDLRTRHGFALVIEHHAAKGEKTARGSAVWMGWPEFGFFLDVTELRDGTPWTVNVDRFRGDRAEAQWPSQLVRGKPWPWEARWPSGTWSAA